MFHLAFDEPGLEAVAAHAEAVVRWAVPLATGERTDLHKEAVKLLRRLAAAAPGRLEILAYEGTVAMLEQAVVLPAYSDDSSDSSGDEGDDTFVSPKLKSALLGLTASLVPSCEDEAVLKALRR